MHCVLILVFFFLLIIPSATPLNFVFPSFSAQDTNTIFTEGDAYLDPESLRLTKSADALKYRNVGRATYKKPFLLQDKTTGELADFKTSFVFSIDSHNNTNYGGGLAFFIVPNGSSLNVRLGAGGSLGLPFNSCTGAFEYPFVAVEFDIYRSTAAAIEDPSERAFSTIDHHVGIDVNSLKSRVTAPWNGGILTGDRNTVTVRYDSNTNNLSVGFTNFLSVHSISYKVDLNKYLPDRVIVGFSASTVDSIAMHKIISWNFTSSLDESLKDELPMAPKSAVAAPSTSPVASPLPKSTTTVDLVPAPDAKPRNKNKIKLIVGMAVGGGIILVVGLAVVFFIVRDNREIWGSEEDPMTHDQNDIQFKKIGLRKFSYKELASATSNFDKGKKLGEGGFGEVYKGHIINSKIVVAVKKISPVSRQGRKEYEAEVKIISALEHPHLVQLIGCCDENGEFMLVYKFVPNGSLDTHLFKKKPLSWKVRYKIVQELASVISYLQEERGRPCVVHRDIKSSNIMLESDFTAKLGDFGLARLLDREQSLKTTSVAGTTGYMAPEYVTHKAASKKSDVYSFGIVALEIACGRRPIVDKPERGKSNIVEWVWELYGVNKVNEAADPKLCGKFDEEQMTRLMVVGLWCAHPDHSHRASIQNAIDVLGCKTALPILLSPVAAFAPTKISIS